jgi:hypothetical protein
MCEYVSSYSRHKAVVILPEMDFEKRNPRGDCPLQTLLEERG